MKMIKTRLRNPLGEQNLAYLMRIAIEMPEKLPDDRVESVVDIWNRKTRRIAALIFCFNKISFEMLKGGTNSLGGRMPPTHPP